jgi:hypothetical protein
MAFGNALGSEASLRQTSTMDEPLAKGPLPPPRAKGRTLILASAGLGLAGLACLIWRMAGWFGVGVFGPLVMFLSVRIDLKQNAPVGSLMTPDLYAAQFRNEGLRTQAERAASRLERLEVIRGARAGLLMGVLLVVLGFGLFAILP